MIAVSVEPRGSRSARESVAAAAAAASSVGVGDIVRVRGLHRRDSSVHRGLRLRPRRKYPRHAGLTVRPARAALQEIAAVKRLGARVRCYRAVAAAGAAHGSSIAAFGSVAADVSCTYANTSPQVDATTTGHQPGTRSPPCT